MSLIYGCINLESHKKHPTDVSLLQSMQSSLKLGWEPNEEKTWYDTNCHIGQLTLFNTPESRNETLPWKDNKTGYVIAADARIDNRPELAQKLGLTLNKISDSQLILISYEKWREKCVQHLIGDFVFVIWDSKRRSLFCARDHLGVKPLFYCQDRGNFYFSSLPRALSQLPFIHKKHTKQQTLALLLPTPRWDKHTYFGEIMKLPPAHSMLLTQNGMQLDHYWAPNTKPKETNRLSDEEYLHAFQEMLQRAVSDRLRSYRPIAVQVSGGLDSSGILAIATPFIQKSRIPLYTYTHALSEQCRSYCPHLNDDLQLSQEVCDFTENHPPQKVTIKDEIYLSLIDKLLEINGSPVDRGEMTLSSYLLCKSASQNNAVTMLSGFCGDEAVTSACGQFIELAFQDNNFRSLFMFSLQHPKQALTWGIKRLQVALFQQQKHTDSRMFFKDIPPEPVLHGSPHSVGGHSRLPSHRFNRWDKIISSYVSLRFETEYTAAAYWGMENRYPLADIRLIELYHQLPVHLKNDGNLGRWIFRKTMDGKLPNKVVWTKKSNNPVIPGMMTLWKKNEAQIQDYLLSLEDINIPPYINLPELISHFKQVNQGMIGSGKKRMHVGIVNFVMQLLRYNEDQHIL